MSNFIQITQKFSDFNSLLGLAIFSRDGRFIDTSLPLSDEFSEDLGRYFDELVNIYRDQGRHNNRFVIELGEKTLIFAEHAKGAFLFMVQGTSEIDAILGAFGHLYPSVAPAPVLVEVPKEVVQEVQPVEEEISNVSRRSPMMWAIPGAAAVTAMAIAFSGIVTTATADEKKISAEKEMLEASLEREVAALKAQEMAEQKAAELMKLEEMRLAEVARMEAEKMAQAKEQARLAAEAAAEEARLKAEEEAAAAAALEAERIAMEEKAAAAAKLAEEKKAAAKKSVVRKAAAKKKHYSKKRKSSKKPRTHCMND